VVGLRPGYRHVVLRNESGQPLNLPTIFLNIRVKDYVPDGLSDFAEALANPIKYQSELEKRSKQLSVLQDDTMQDDSSTNEDSESTVPSAPKASFKVQPSFRNKPKSIENPSSEMSASPPSGHIIPIPPTKTESIEEGKKCLGPMPTPPPNLAAFALTGGSDVTHIAGSSSNDVTITFAPEPLEKFWENKTYKEKKAQLEKKVEEMKRKHEKDRKDRKPPKKSHRKLVTRLSSKNLEETISKKESIPASQSLICEQLILEKDALEKGHEELFKIVEKAIKDAHGKQLKLLSSLEVKDGDGVMKWVDNWRKDEFKRLAKQTKDKNELDRIKREVTRSLVDKGVVEREKKAKLYHEIKNQLEQAHKDVLRHFQDCKDRRFQEIEKDYKERFNQLVEESSGGVGVVAETFPETSFH
jgi:phosphatidylinositol phospholipase C beta